MKKAKEYTDMQLAFLDALFDDAENPTHDIRKAMDLAGYSKGSQIHAIVGALRDEIIERTESYIAMHSPKAAGAIVGTVNDPTALGAKVRIDAAKEILDRSGIVKKEKVEVSGNVGGLFILPPKDD